MSKKIIVNNPSHLATTSYKNLKDLQGNLKTLSKENDIITDFFLGSGTTLIAAHQTGRICYGCEIDPHYIDVILDRYAKFTGDDCIREGGVKWSELKSSKAV